MTYTLITTIKIGSEGPDGPHLSIRYGTILEDELVIEIDFPAEQDRRSIHINEDDVRKLHRALGEWLGKIGNYGTGF